MSVRACLVHHPKVNFTCDTFECYDAFLDILDILPESVNFLQTSTSFLASLEDLSGQPRGALLTASTMFLANPDGFSCNLDEFSWESRRVLVHTSMGFPTNLDELYCKPRRGHQPFSRGSFTSLDDANASQTQFDMFLYVSSTLVGSSSKGIFLLATLATVATHF